MGDRSLDEFLDAGDADAESSDEDASDDEPRDDGETAASNADAEPASAGDDSHVGTGPVDDQDEVETGSEDDQDEAETGSEVDQDDAQTSPGDDENATETGPEGERGGALGSTEGAEDGPAVDPSTVDPAESTYVRETGGGPCAACGETVERRWRSEGGLVCPDCKEW